MNISKKLILTEADLQNQKCFLQSIRTLINEMLRLNSATKIFEPIIKFINVNINRDMNHAFRFDISFKN